MPHAIPVFATSRQGVSIGDLTLEISWVRPDGTLAKDVETTPVQNGVAVYHGPPLEPGVLFAIRIRSSVGGVVFRSGPLRKLPGPPSVAVINGAIRLYLTGFSFSLTNFGSDGVPEILVQNLQNLPAPLQFSGVRLGSDGEGHYSVTLFGRVRVLFFAMSFAYTRLFQLVPSLDPGRPTPVVVAQPFGSPSMSGVAVAPYRGVLDGLMKNAVEQQLNTALVGLANLDYDVANPGTFGAINLVSMNNLWVGGNAQEASLDVGNLGGAWIAGGTVVLQPSSPSATSAV